MKLLSDVAFPTKPSRVMVLDHDVVVLLSQEQSGGNDWYLQPGTMEWKIEGVDFAVQCLDREHGYIAFRKIDGPTGKPIVGRYRLEGRGEDDKWNVVVKLINYTGAGEPEIIEDLCPYFRPAISCANRAWRYLSMEAAPIDLKSSGLRRQLGKAAIARVTSIHLTAIRKKYNITDYAPPETPSGITKGEHEVKSYRRWLKKTQTWSKEVKPHKRGHGPCKTKIVRVEL